MLQCRQMINEGFMEIRFTERATEVYGVQLGYRVAPDEVFRPCAIFPAIDADAEGLLGNSSVRSFWDWNEAVRSGIVRFNSRAKPLYWNLYLNGLHTHQGLVQLHVELLDRDGIVTHDLDVEFQPVKAAYVDNWAAILGADSGWSLENGHLTVLPGTKTVKPLVLKPRLQGRYKVWIGTPGEPGSLGDLGILIRASDNPCRYFLCKDYHPGLWLKTVELPWKVVDFTPDLELEIGIGERKLQTLDLYPFGRLAYVKFTPAERIRRRSSPRWNDKKLIFHFESGSWPLTCGLSVCGLSSPESVRQALWQLREMGADEVNTQVLRLGTVTGHNSCVVEKFKAGSKYVTDDGTVVDGIDKESAAFDLLRATIKFSRELGLFHYANAGMTVCYTGSALEDRFSREHPEWRHGDMGFLSYCHPETRAYAAAVIREFVEWGTDGVSIDCMRYPYGQSTDDLIALFTELSLAIRQAARGKRIPLAARIPDGNSVYFKAFDRLVREGHVHCVIPSTLATGPVHSLKPYLKWKNLGCRVYGRIDGHNTFLWRSDAILFTPREIRSEIRRFFREGADGIFVYQADTYFADPFNRTAFDWRKW